MKELLENNANYSKVNNITCDVINTPHPSVIGCSVHSDATKVHIAMHKMQNI